jgi:hypothetical protein
MFEKLAAQWRVSTEDCLEPESTALRVPEQTFKGTVVKPVSANQAGNSPFVVRIKQLGKDGNRQRCSMNLTDEQHAICHCE